ncbi:hypothetical protein EIN_381340 [Entamoeba invadens IP1]|uniref:Leucine rich repeat containing protein BspA family protein n=1 Tax=Entamoeba invadens IP1 TaxID=370355 RepID=A0A0A1UAS8_ENTIV|nr:hypothetical protein EIN_381340 [Entamoeba invadens IP1]ELP92167.1 hypothetical protein EIN_381340 [Entamoeba invadens IP1]|eukprot:XP_004258938.1 hypothetical protein EIN_381340 [Entamoeba invadens IP1]
MAASLTVFYLQIVSKYFTSADDFVNAVLINKKFSSVLDRFRYNPIPVRSKKLFPYMETQHIYMRYEEVIPSIKRVVIWYEVTFNETQTLFSELTTTFKHIKATFSDVQMLGITQFTDIPNTVTIYGSKVLNNFKIDSVSLPSHITKLDRDAFSGNTNLTTVELTENITEIPVGCFQFCENLLSLNIPSSVLIIDSSAFEKCGITALTLPNTVKCIESFLFGQCDNLVEVKISQSIISLAHYTFSECTKLSSVILPDNLLYIGTDAFSNCSSLKELHIPKSVLYVDYGAFMNCVNIKELVFSKNCTLKQSTFIMCTSLTKLIVPTLNGRVKHLISYEEVDIFKKFYDDFCCETDEDNCLNDNGEFNDKKRFTKLVSSNQKLVNSENYYVPDNYHEVYKYTFSLNSTFKVIDFGNNIMKLENGICDNSNNLQEVFMSPLVLQLPEMAFNGCKQLKQIVNMENVTQIGNLCFNDCSSLRSLIVNNNAKMGVGCVVNCVSLTRLDIPNTNKIVNFQVGLNERPIIEKFGYKCFKIEANLNKDGADVVKTILSLPDDVYLTVNGSYPKVHSLTVFSPIKKIKGSFFKNVSGEVDLGSVQEMGSCCLNNAITSITLPTTLTKIRRNVFEKCNNLQHVDLCGKSSFFGCVSVIEQKRLEKCGVTCDNVIFGSDEWNQFKCISKEFKTLDLNNKSKWWGAATYFEMPNNIVTIEKDCFSNYNLLTQIILSDTLEEIKESAFESCYSLESIKFPKSLKRIGELAFYRCVKLKEVIIPSNVTQIGDFAFNECFQIQRAVIPNITINNTSVFNWCTLLSKVKFINNDETTCKLFNKTFAFCLSLKTILIPESVEKIQENSFEEMTSLVNIEIPENVVLIENRAFLNCISLSKITFGKSVESLGGFCFENCVSLREIELPQSITSIQSCCFKNCSNLKRVIFDADVPKCSYNTFEECISLSEFYISKKRVTEITLPVTCAINEMLRKNGIQSKNVVFVKTDVEVYLRIDYENGKKIGRLPENVVEIGNNCFRGCKNVDVIEIHKNVKCVGRFAFYNSIDINNVLFMDPTTTTINSRAFK